MSLKATGPCTGQTMPPTGALTTGCGRDGPLGADGAEAVSLLKDKAMEQVSPVTHHLTEVAAAPRTREQIGALIKKEVHEYYEGLPFFKKIFVSRENLLREVDDLVNESLPRRIEETLKGDFFAGEARSFIDKGIDNALARPLREIVGTVEPEQLESLKDQITVSVLKLIRSEAVTSQVSGYVRETIERFRPHSIDSILRTLYPESEEKIKTALVNGLMDVIARPETSRIINELLARQIDGLLSAPIGRQGAPAACNLGPTRRSPLPRAPVVWRLTGFCGCAGRRARSSLGVDKRLRRCRTVSKAREPVFASQAPASCADPPTTRWWPAGTDWP